MAIARRKAPEPLGPEAGDHPAFFVSLYHRNHVLARLASDHSAYGHFVVALEAVPAQQVPHLFCLLPLMRHASTVDTVFPHVLVANRNKMTLRFVLKKELLWDPCVDVVGNRIRNIFVERSGSDSEKDISAVRRLAMELKPSEGIVIFPEGTRFHPEKLKRVPQKLKLSGDTVLYDMAGRMTHVLPPRPGGFLALIESARGADVVFCAHTGLEGAATFRQLWKGLLIGKTVCVRFYKMAASGIPENARDALIWLYEEWLRIDSWIQMMQEKSAMKGELLRQTICGPGERHSKEQLL
jgi:1-acyl-sn-glycerol-3-phosphate acyltransferase